MRTDKLYTTLFNALASAQRPAFIKALLLACILLYSVQGSTQTINSFAGNGVNGYSGDGGPATAASLALPYGLIVDGRGNVYIDDIQNYVVRKVDTSGVITTFAGNGTQGYSGDGGAATAAQLNQPSGVTVDGSGNLYIADYFAHVVRKVDTFGTITTFAGTGASGYSGDGGAATAAQISAPYGLTTDGAGDLYIVDSNVIREVSASGIITTIAGTGAAGYSGDGGPATAALFNSPFGITLDGNGSIYISDLGNFVVRRIDASGIITTFAGNDTLGFSGNGGAATAAELGAPQGITADWGGNIYITDLINNVVWKVNTSGIITIFSGNGTLGSTGNGGPATAAELLLPVSVASYGDDLYIGSGDHTVRKITPANTAPAFTGALQNLVVCEDAAATDITGLLDISDVDSGQTETWSQATAPAHGALAFSAATASSGSTNIAPGGTITYMPATGYSGPDTFSVQVSDGTGGTVAVNITVTVNPLPAPTLTTVPGAHICVSATAIYATQPGMTGYTWAIPGTPGTDYTITGGGITTDSVTLVWLTTGSKTVTINYTNSNGCTGAAAAANTILVNPLPAPITGNTSVCNGLSTSLNDLTGGGSWSSSNTSLATVNAITGVVSGVSSGTSVITYRLPTGCTAFTTATVNAHPTVYTITGGGSYCAGTGGLHIGLSSSDPGIAYQLFYGITQVGSPLIGTGSPLDFGLQTLAETYTVVANNVSAAGCSANMSGSAAIVTNALPAVFTVTGGGSYCATGAGVHIGLNGVTPGISYQLYNGSVPAGPAVTGGVSPLDFGLVTAAGSYKAVATNNVTTCTSNMADSAIVVINPALVPSVSIATGLAGNMLCAGSLITITATAINGGTLPAYSWSVNGIPVPVLGSTYTYLPSDGDHITATLTSSAACVSPATAGSSLTVNVLPAGTPAIHISSLPGDTVCQGTLVNFTASSAYGGASPSLIWMVNGITAGSGAAYSYTPADHDVIYCVLGSNYFCRTTNSAVSNNITINAEAAVAPVVAVTAAPGTSVAEGQSVTLTAAVTNGGVAPTYQWYVNGGEVAGADQPAFTRNTFVNGDTVSCIVTSNGVCGALSGRSFVAMHVISTGIQSVTSAGSNIRLAPNPNKGTFTVSGALGTTGNEEVTLVVCDMLGQVVYTHKVMTNNGAVNEQISLNSGLANGMYLLNIISATQNNVFHFVIEK